MKGTVKWYNFRKGYGFIQGEDNKDIFVHRSALPMGMTIDENDSVEYEVEETDRGLNATNITKSTNE